jgi:hypothetical protein
MFKRAGVYYAVFGHCCCYCLQGSGGFVYTASAPLGPWVAQAQPLGDVICEVPLPGSVPAAPTPDQGCLYGGGADTAAVTRAQASYVVRAPIPNSSSSDSDTLIWAGDRWGQSPDGLKGHEPQFWAPLRWDDTASPPVLQHLRWLDNFTVDLGV